MNFTKEHWLSVVLSTLFGIIHFHGIRHLFAFLSHKTMKWVEEEGEGRFKKSIGKWLKKGKEKHMAKQAKTSIRFTRTDGLKPRLDPDGSISLFTPVPLMLGPGSAVKVDLGIRFSVPVFITSRKVALAHQLVAPGELVVLVGASTVTEPTPVAAGERIAVVLPLAAISDIELEQD
jgi:hypothetical protein